MDTLLLEGIKIGASAAAGVAGGVWLSRRKVSLAVVSVLPSSKTDIKGYFAALPDELRSVLDDSHWTSIVRDFRSKEDLTDLNEEVRRQKVLLKAADVAVQTVEKVITSLQKPNPTDGDLAALISELLSNVVVGRMLAGMAKRKTISWQPQPPNKKPTIPFREEKIGAGFKGDYGRFLLKFDDFVANFAYTNPFEREAMEQLCLGLAFPDVTVLHANVAKVKDELLEDVNRANRAVALAEPLIVNASRWVVCIQVSNRSPVSVVLAPSGRLLIRAGGEKYEPIDLFYHPSAYAECLPRQAEHESKERLTQAERDIEWVGTTLDPEEKTTNENIVVGPHSCTRATLISYKPVSAHRDCDKILTFHEKHMAKYSVKLELRPRGFRISPWVRSAWTLF